MSKQASPLTGQFNTWFQHGIISAFIPAVVVGLTGSFELGFISAFFTCVGYVIWEGMNYRSHLKKGDWNTPEASTGITPRMDQMGDLVGPVTVMLTYCALAAALYLGGGGGGCDPFC